MDFKTLFFVVLVVLLLIITGLRYDYRLTNMTSSDRQGPAVEAYNTPRV